MKYTALFGLAALTLGFCACDEIEESTGLPQTNPQLPIVTVDNVPVTPDAAVEQSVNLTTANNNGGTIDVAVIGTPTDFPEGFAAEVLWFEIGNDAAFTKKASVQATTDADGNVVAQADDWQAAHVKVFGKNPKASTTYVRIPAWAVDGKQQIRLGDENEYYSTFSTEVTPLDLFDGHVIEDAYYLLYSNSKDSWDFSKAIKFNHSEYDPYDDPTFTVNVPAQTAAWYWIVVPESTYATGGFVNGPESSYSVEYASKLSGNLMTNDSDDYGTPGKVTTLNVPMSVTVEMAKLTYDVASLVLYTPGVANGWEDLTATQVLMTSDGKTYTGFAHLKDGFKFATPTTWYGFGGDGKLSTDGGASDIKVKNDGLYWCTANVEALTYSLGYVERLCLVGDASPAGWNVAADDATAVKFTPSADYLVWTVVVTLKDGGVKIHANSNWDIQLGDINGELVNNGGSGNIPGPGAGKYLVTLDLSARPYSLTFTPQP